MIFMFSGRIYTSAYRTDVESTPADTLQIRITHGHMPAYGNNLLKLSAYVYGY